MFGVRGTIFRFNLLLLEENEYYVSDCSVTCIKWPAHVLQSSSATIKGQIRVASKSLFFDPNDRMLPIVRIVYDKVNRLQQGEDSQKSFVICSGNVYCMKINNEDHPYIRYQDSSGMGFAWEFLLDYQDIDSFLPQTLVYLQCAKVQSLEEKRRLLEELGGGIEKKQSFDSSRLVDYTENILMECGCKLVVPLVCEAGLFVLTQKRIYFEALHDIRGDQAVRTHPLSLIVAEVRRRSTLRPVGIELFFVDTEDNTPTWDAPSAFFTFRTVEDRDKVLHSIQQQGGLGTGLPSGPQSAAHSASLLEADSEWLRRVTSAWSNADITNLDYLMYLNFAAGRSFNDLAQWPVFPWILNDYSSDSLELNNADNFRDLSKAIGALNSERLERFKQRMSEAISILPEDPPFLYGTHYSCPAYVMYWLVRVAPGHLLRLQGGKFDDPDRMFQSIKESWDSVCNNFSDLKELIPEFFLPGGEFLVNGRNLNLGTRQNGSVIGDVGLPNWATSPDDFIQKHRTALESPYVSQNLHHWIDLIFGYKQQGAAALDADNLFHPLSYEGTVDLDNISDEVQRRGIEVHVNEFGQTPSQLFKTPHPQRQSIPNIDQIQSQLNQSEHTNSHHNYNRTHLWLLNFLRDLLEAASKHANQPALVLQQQPPAAQPPTPTPTPATMPASHLFVPATFHTTPPTPTPMPKSNGKPADFVQNLTADISSKLISFGKKSGSDINRMFSNINRQQQKPKLSVSQLQQQPQLQYEKYPSVAGSASQWSPSFLSQLQPLKKFDMFNDCINAVVLSKTKKMLFSAGSSGEIKFCNLEGQVLGQYNHSGEVHSLALLDEGHILCSGGFKNIKIWQNDSCVGSPQQPHSDVVKCLQVTTANQILSGGWDGLVKVWDIGNGSLSIVREFVGHGSEVWSTSCVDQLIATGLSDGIVNIWDMRSTNRPIKSKVVSQDYISGIQLFPQRWHMVVSSGEGGVGIFDLRMWNSDGLNQLFSYQTKDPIHCCQSDGQFAVFGSESGAIRILDIQKQQFQSAQHSFGELKPITSLVIEQIGDQTMLCSSCEDGSILLFQT